MHFLLGGTIHLFTSLIFCWTSFSYWFVLIFHLSDINLLCIVAIFVASVYFLFCLECFWKRFVDLFLAESRLFLVAAGGVLSRCGAWASHCGSFSCGGAQALGAWVSVDAACRLRGCGKPCSLPCSIWDLPRPGIEPMSPALAGGFLTIEPSGKPYNAFEIQKFEL